MNVIVNGEGHQTQCQTLQELLEDLHYTSGAVATAINGTFIASAQRADTTLSDGAQIEIVAPMQGG